MATEGVPAAREALLRRMYEVFATDERDAFAAATGATWIGDAARAGRLAELLLERGVYVIGFSYPVVPQGQARIRVQLSAAHSTADVNRAVDAFVAARAELAG